MTVRMAEGRVALEGACGVDEAEPLLQLLQSHPGTVVELGGCTHIHTSVAQVLIATRPPISGSPADGFLRDWLVPLLTPPSAIRSD